MSVACKDRPAAQALHVRARRAAPVLALALSAALAGCTHRDSVTVGAIPDDYRTNHPIVIAEKPQVLDLPVGADDRNMTRDQRETLEGFLTTYDRRAAPVLSILVPSGAANDAAAARVARQFARFARKNGVPSGQIVITSYSAGAPDASAPVRITFNSMVAQTNKCGRWPEDMLQDSAQNKHYANFGCSYQNNLAAQISNPADLLGPRKQSPIDATRQSNVITDWQNGETVFPPFPAEVGQDILF